MCIAVFMYVCMYKIAIDQIINSQMLYNYVCTYINLKVLVFIVAALDHYDGTPTIRK